MDRFEKYMRILLISTCSLGIFASVTILIQSFIWYTSGTSISLAVVSLGMFISGIILSEKLK